MNEMKPLLDSELPEDLASVLRSADADGPPEHAPAEARTLAAVAAHRAAGSNANEGRATTRIPFARSMLAPVVGACVGAAVVFASLVWWNAPLGANGTAAPTPSAPQAPASAARPPASASPEGVRIDDLPTARVEEAAPKPAGRPPVRRGDSAAELEDELAMIDSARAALAAKRPEATLAGIRAYHRRFRAGHFTEEADALEIQALVAMGRRDEAKAKGERFLASHPGSAYVRRVQSAVASEVKP